MKIKNKKKTNTTPLRYQIHINKPDQLIKNFEFILLNDFIKKAKKESVTDIVLHDVLEYTDSVDRIDLFKNIISKLKPGGKLYIQGTDAKLLSSAFLYGQIDLNIFKTILFGNGKNTILSISEITSMISGIDHISIGEIKSINAIQYYVECVKDE